MGPFEFVITLLSFVYSSLGAQRRESTSSRVSEGSLLDAHPVLRATGDDSL